MQQRSTVEATRSQDPVPRSEAHSRNSVKRFKLYETIRFMNREIKGRASIGSRSAHTSPTQLQALITGRCAAADAARLPRHGKARQAPCKSNTAIELALQALASAQAKAA